MVRPVLDRLRVRHGVERDAAPAVRLAQRVAHLGHRLDRGLRLVQLGVDGHHRPVGVRDVADGRGALVRLALGLGLGLGLLVGGGRLLVLALQSLAAVEDEVQPARDGGLGALQPTLQHLQLLGAARLVSAAEEVPIGVGDEGDARLRGRGVLQPQVLAPREVPREQRRAARDRRVGLFEELFDLEAGQLRAGELAVVAGDVAEGERGEANLRGHGVSRSRDWLPASRCLIVKLRSRFERSSALGFRSPHLIFPELESILHRPPTSQSECILWVGRQHNVSRPVISI